MSVDRDKLKKAVIDYLGGGKIKRIDCVPDPHNCNYTALRITFENGEKQHMLYNSKFSDPEEGLEEVEFSKWPPTSNKRNMFNIENMNVMVTGG